MPHMPHFSEEDLIAYQLHESSDEAAIQRHLELCPECAATSDSIAETLRVFSSAPVPQPDLDRNWQRLRGNLSVLTPAPAPRPSSPAFCYGQRRAWRLSRSCCSPSSASTSPATATTSPIFCLPSSG